MNPRATKIMVSAMRAAWREIKGNPRQRNSKKICRTCGATRLQHLQSATMTHRFRK